MKTKMKYIGYSEYDYPAYEDDSGRIWLDINYGNISGIVNLYSSSNGLAGEPVNPIQSDIEIKFINKFQRVPRELDYMLLSRYKSDCEYFLGYGDGYEGHLYFGSIQKQIEEMKKLYNSFPDECKPSWITIKAIEEYDKKMQGKLKEKQLKKQGNIL